MGRNWKRLTIVSVAFPFAIVSADPVGGAEQVLAQIDRALAAGGHRSIVIAASGSVAAGELVTAPPCSGPIGWTEWARAHDFLRNTICRTVADSRADLVHMHGVDFPQYLPPPGVRVLATLHMPVSYYRQESLKLSRPATWLNTVSRYQHERLQSHPRVVRLVENGVPSPPRAKVNRAAFAFAMGRICPEKGFHLALDAAKLANRPFKLAGAVSNFPEHRDYVEREIRPRLDRSRQWIGPVCGTAKWHRLQAASCVVVPSLVEETASLVAREALAAGTPVIAYPSGALSEIVEHGKTGFLVKSVEEMAQALERTSEIDPAVCRRLASERYSADRMAQQYLELYQDLLQVDA
jgi:glycosyltransferase involved in cell wall biosynthesis